LQPLRFREAVSSLHDVVISDLRYVKPDKTAYREYAASIQQRESSIRQSAADQRRDELKQPLDEPVPPELEHHFAKCRDLYWKSRQRYSDYLYKNDRELWRLMMPCDPIVTVAPDVVMLECFSKDESSYGCLSVSRDAFRTTADVALGTTNVDYSWNLYEEFQTLRSYRNTAFVIDPKGVEVQSEDRSAYREEKIDLPETWLRGFLQLQAAMTLPMRKVRLPIESVYSILAFLKRTRAKSSPRAIRFELMPGEVPRVFLEPWSKEIVVSNHRYAGPKAETIRIWGRDRLQALARMLPIASHVDVGLIGSGFPSFWMAAMGEMQFTLGLSGWTANDWSGLLALDQLAPPGTVNDLSLEKLASTFRSSTSQSLATVAQQSGLALHDAAAGLNQLALLGQVIHDVSTGVFRWRQVIPTPLTREQLGPPNPELVAAKELVARGKVKIVSNEQLANGNRLLMGQFSNHLVELMVDSDHIIVRGKCNCSHHFRFGLKKGPCQHLQALRNKAFGTQLSDLSLQAWYKKFWEPQ
jgi:hypothetical protein